jgi:hypothetical protein
MGGALRAGFFFPACCRCAFRFAPAAVGLWMLRTAGLEWQNYCFNLWKMD